MWSSKFCATQKIFPRRFRLFGTTADGPSKFSGAKLGSFYQELPKLGNPFLDDGPVQRYLQRLCGSDKEYSNWVVDLTKFGKRISEEIDRLGRQCELNQPHIRHYDVSGRRVDELITCEAWRCMKAIAAEEGLISIGYTDKNRLYQMAKLYLFAPSSGLYSCPLAMTDGAAKVISEMRKTDKPVSNFMEEAYEHLISRDPQKFWTSGQWMTEKRGGSDVGNATETVAVQQPNGAYKLYGYKFFSSATDADVALTLARPLDKDGTPLPSTNGLSLFLVQVRRDPNVQSIQIIRLKDKLGTRQLPTAELLLDGAIAEKVSEDGRGVSTISHMLNITRIHNAISSVAAMRRIIMLARDYAHKRSCFGKRLIDHPLHLQTLARLEVETRGNVLMVFEVAKLLGLSERGEASEGERVMLRFLTPLVKLYSAKQAMSVISEGLECFGGLGYMEDSGLPSILRDAQVLPIWEGTTNILSLDILRILAKHGEKVMLAYQQTIDKKLATAFSNANSELHRVATKIASAAGEIMEFVNSNSPKVMELAARDLAFSLSSVFIGASLIEHAVWNGATPSDVQTAINWAINHPLIYLNIDYYTSKSISHSQLLVLDG